MKKPLLFASIGLLLVVFQSCVAPAPIYRLSPDRKDTRWLSGREYLSDMKDSISVVLAYTGTSNQNILFDLEISNFSSVDVLVDPAVFTYKGLNANKESLFLVRNNEYVQAWGKARNPEEEILETFKKENRAVAEAKNARTAAIVTAVVATTAVVGTAVATSSSSNTSSLKKDEKSQSNDLRTAQAASASLVGVAEVASVNAASSQERSFFEVQSLQELRQNWEQSALRKTHLGPKQRMRGTVVYRRLDEAAFMEITIWVADKQFPFLFQQHKIVVSP